MSRKLKHNFKFNNFCFFETLAVYEIMWIEL